MNPQACKSCGTPTLRPGGYCQECEFMTQDEAAKRLHVSRSTWFRMVKAGTVKPRRIGPRRTVVARAEIDNLLAGQVFAQK